MLTVHEKLADPDAPVESFAVTVTLELAAVVGVPEIKPDELIDRPAGRPAALYVKAAPPESLPLIWSETAVPTVELCEPGLFTVTVLPGGHREGAHLPARRRPGLAKRVEGLGLEAATSADESRPTVIGRAPSK